MTNGVVTIATAASAAGDKDEATPTANNTFTATDAISLTVTGGGSGGAPRIHVVLECIPTRVLHGTFTAGVTSVATATTGDVRGTYAPVSTPDGALTYQLLAWLPNPLDRGVAQFAG